MTEKTLQKSTVRCNERNPLIEAGLRLFLIYLFVQLELLTPFERPIYAEEMWMYKNPRRNSYVSAWMLFAVIVPLPFLIFAIDYALNGRQRRDFRAATLGYSLALGINGLITDLLKVTVGRPRPDFFWRCFPDGLANAEMQCHGDPYIVAQGRKSFPSGHASFSWASMSFISFYVCGKLHCFNDRGRGDTLHLVGALSPYIVAMLVAVSRTCDFHHHYADVAVGSLIGFSVAYLCYRQYYPALGSRLSHLPVSSHTLEERSARTPRKTAARSHHRRSLSLSDSETRSLLDSSSSGVVDSASTKEAKWI